MDHQPLRDWCESVDKTWLTGKILKALDERDALERRVKELETMDHVVEPDEPRCLDNFRIFLADNPHWTNEVGITVLDAQQILRYVDRLRKERDRLDMIEKASSLLRSLISPSDEPSPDPAIESVVAKFRNRSKVGIDKYGATLDRDDLDRNDWLKHLQEELMDAVNYIEASIRKDNPTS